MGLCVWVGVCAHGIGIHRHMIMMGIMKRLQAKHPQLTNDQVWKTCNDHVDMERLHQRAQDVLPESEFTLPYSEFIPILTQHNYAQELVAHLSLNE